MRIAKTYEVSFHGKLSDLGTPAAVDYWIVDDKGERFQVKVTNHPKLIEAFEWMSDNDCLRHLQHVGNQYTTNTAEVEAAQHKNAFIEENAYALGQVSMSYSPMTGQKQAYVPGLVKVPEHTFEAKWTFWSREHAVMFKLACGGEL